jgi:soluble lytic murein transglycosylase-like protein
MKNRMYIPLALLLLAGSVLPGRAAERVTLRNGFDLVCNHHVEVDGKVRLFSGKTDDSYIEVAPEQIAGYEWAPDPPPPPAEAITPEATAPIRDAHLSPEDLREMLAKAGKEHNVDEDLLASVVKAESGGNARAMSRAGARGLMQLMPATAAELGVKDSFEPEQNVRGGTAYLDALLTYYHNNLALALAAYNAGPAAVAKYRGIPPYAETRAYIARVIHEFNRRVLARRAQARLAAVAQVSSGQ